MRRPRGRSAVTPSIRRILFPDVQELQAFLDPVMDGQNPGRTGAGTRVPLLLLGSSLFSAQLAAYLGLPFAFASHFAPADLLPALAIYRERFKPSRQLAKPYAMIVVNVFAADTDAEARRQFTLVQQSFTQLRRGQPLVLAPWMIWLAWPPP